MTYCERSDVVNPLMFVRQNVSNRFVKSQKKGSKAQELFATLKNLLKSVQNSSCDRYHTNLTKYLYSEILPKGFSKSGSECAEKLLSGTGDDQYTIPRDEIRFLERNGELICDFFKEKLPNVNLVHISLGCGPYSPVFTKDLLLARSCNVSRYIAVDINKQFAQAAANLIQTREPSIKTTYLQQDFAKELRLKNILKTHLPLMSLFGGTLGQYPINPHNDENFSLRSLLTNFAISTNHSGILFATLDTENFKPRAESKYQGPDMIQLMNTLWGTIKEITGDSEFNPHAFKYTAEFDEISNSVLFVHQVKKSTSIKIDGNRYNIPKGIEFVIGQSLKTGPEDIIKNAEEFGWKKADIPFQYDSTTRAIVLFGNKLAKQMNLKSSLI